MSEMLSQEEIEALMRASESSASGGSGDVDAMLLPDEKDAIGEIGNISMGASATTLFTLLGRRVSITTPHVRLYSSKDILSEYSAPYIVVQVYYTEGIKGNNLLLLKQDDAAIITDLLMGGDGIVEPGKELGELEISAMSEIMNQMVGASATSLANLLGTPVNISTPVATVVHFGEEPSDSLLTESDVYCKVSFLMEIEGLLNSELMQIMPLEFARDLVKPLLATNNASSNSAPPPPPAPPPPQTPPPQTAPPPPQQAAPQQAYAQAAPQQAYAQPQYAPPPQQPYGQPQYPPPQNYGQPQYPPPRQVEVRNVQYQAFDGPGGQYAEQYTSENMDIIVDVPLQVTVELGKAKRSIREVLDFTMGSIIVLDKLAGEMVDVLVNGKLIARGEVVVIEENYGVRITDIVSPSRRLSLTT